MPDVTKLATTAADHNDRWAFFAVLIVCGIMVVWFGKYLLKRNEEMMLDHKQDRKTYEESLNGLFDRANESNLKMAVCVEQNTEILRECKDELKVCREDRRKK